MSAAERVPVIVARLRNHFPEVNRVADSSRPVQLEVTAADCKRGARGEADSCAMARACKRELKCDGVLIWRSTAWVVTGDTAVKYSVPASLSREIAIFDRGAEFMPGVYGLSKVPKSASVSDAARARRSGNKIRGKKPGARPMLKYHRTDGIRVSR